MPDLLSLTGKLPNIQLFWEFSSSASESKLSFKKITFSHGYEEYLPNMSQEQ